MTDIVERLRAADISGHGEYSALVREAATEIERLRAALTEILDIGDASSGSDWGDLVQSRYIARAAINIHKGGE